MRATGILAAMAALTGTAISLTSGPQDPAFPALPQPMNRRDSGIGRMIPDFSGHTLSGSTQSLAASDAKGYVIAMTSAACPISRKYGPSLARLEKECASMGVRLVFVNSSPEETAEDKAAHYKSLGVTAPYFDDSSQSIARTLNARITTEVFVLDQSRTLVYRGALDDQYGIGYAKSEPQNSYVRDALAALAKGEPKLWNATVAPGCILNVEAGQTEVKEVTYSAEISRIIQRNCLPCHHDGGTAPFSLEDYSQVKPRAAMIEHVVTKGIMPPWFAEPQSKESPWKNDMSIPADEKAALLKWIKDGAPEGDRSLLPAKLTFKSGWKLGEPDAIFELPRPVAIKAEGVMEYHNVLVPSGFTEDKWVSGIQVAPTAIGVVHHVLIFLRQPGQASGSDGEGINGFFGAWVPGNDSLIYPDGYAKRVPAGSLFKLQIHFTPNGTATTDQTKFALKFADKPVQHEIFTSAAANLFFAIPPGADNHPVIANYTARQDIQILSFLPHMHVRGKAARYELVNGEGASEMLLNIPRYDFNWQLAYELKNPITLTKGNKLKYTAWFDNSPNNPANPDPTKTVRWGDQTFNEMHLGYFEYIIPGQKPGAADPASDSRQGVQAIFDRLDKNGDGVLTKDEVPQAAMFDRLDADKDGKVTLEEALKVLGGG